MEEFEIFYEAEFTKSRADPEYLSQTAAEVQIGVRHLITAAAELGAIIDPEKVFVEAIDRFDEGRKRGVFFRTYVVKGSTPIKTDTVLAELRSLGWSVAVHNDYRQEGKGHTFWLMTHPSGRWVKGEGITDAEALRQIRAAI